MHFQRADLTLDAYAYWTESMMNAPCKNCPDRYPACHGHCEKYQTWLAEYRKGEAAIKEWKTRNREEFLRSDECTWKNKRRGS